MDDAQLIADQNDKIRRLRNREGGGFQAAMVTFADGSGTLLGPGGTPTVYIETFPFSLKVYDEGALITLHADGHMIIDKAGWYQAGFKGKLRYDVQGSPSATIKRIQEFAIELVIDGWDRTIVGEMVQDSWWPEDNGLGGTQYRFRTNRRWVDIVSEPVWLEVGDTIRVSLDRLDGNSLTYLDFEDVHGANPTSVPPAGAPGSVVASQGEYAARFWVRKLD